MPRLSSQVTRTGRILAPDRLVVAGLVVLLAITDMICRAYVTAKRSIQTSVSGLHIPVELHTADGSHRDAELHGVDAVDGARFAQVRYSGQTEDKWVMFDASGNMVNN